MYMYVFHGELTEEDPQIKTFVKDCFFFATETVPQIYSTYQLVCSMGMHMHAHAHIHIIIIIVQTYFGLKCISYCVQMFRRVIFTDGWMDAMLGSSQPFIITPETLLAFSVFLHSSL